jgi:hypothetical protein
MSFEYQLEVIESQLKYVVGHWRTFDVNCRTIEGFWESKESQMNINCIICIFIIFLEGLNVNRTSIDGQRKV